MTYCQIINFFSWFGPWKVNIYQTAYHSLTHWYTLTFLIIFNLINNLYLCPLGISVYVQTAGPSDFQNVSGISFLPANFTIDEDNFSSITEHSLVVLDDFSFKFVNKKQAKINFLKVVNYLILVIHNLFSNNLSNDILCAHHVFLTFTNLGYLIMRWYYILYFYKALHTFFFIFFQKTQSVQKARLIKHTHTNTQTHTHTKTHTNTQIHKHTHTQIHKHTHTHTNTPLGPVLTRWDYKKRGVSSILFISCLAIFYQPTQCVCVYCEHNLCDISLVKHSEFLWTFPKKEWISQNKY